MATLCLPHPCEKTLFLVVISAVVLHIRLNHEHRRIVTSYHATVLHTPSCGSAPCRYRTHQRCTAAATLVQPAYKGPFGKPKVRQDVWPAIQLSSFLGRAELHMAHLLPLGCRMPTPLPTADPDVFARCQARDVVYVKGKKVGGTTAGGIMFGVARRAGSHTYAGTVRHSKN